jgi:hypothetical protein
LVSQTTLLQLVIHDIFRRGRSADIAQTDEQQLIRHQNIAPKTPKDARSRTSHGSQQVSLH